jgi:hypothetical protein
MEEKLVNAVTGKEPTPAELSACKRRAIQIFENQYASPESLEWAIKVYPEGFALLFEEKKPRGNVIV